TRCATAHRAAEEGSSCRRAARSAGAACDAGEAPPHAHHPVPDKALASNRGVAVRKEARRGGVFISDLSAESGAATVIEALDLYPGAQIDFVNRDQLDGEELQE